MQVMRAFRVSHRITAACASAVAVWLAVALGAAGPALSQSASADPIIAIVNGAQVHQSDLQLADEIVGRNLPVHDPVDRREALFKMVTDAMLVAQIAKERNVVDEADIQRRINYARNQGLMRHFLTVIGQEAVTDDAIRKAYEDVVLAPGNSVAELHLRQIYFPVLNFKDDVEVKAAQDKAQAALDRIKKGEDFAAVASDVTQDPAAKATGGDFGWRTKNEMGAEIAEWALKVEKGDVSPLIKTSAGWHIVKLEDKRIRKPPDLSSIRGRIAAMLAANAEFEFVEKTREAAKIERLDAPQAPEAQQVSDAPKAAGSPKASDAAKAPVNGN